MDLVSLVIPLAACALSGASLGCSVIAEPATVTVPASTGTLTVRWLVAGGTDPRGCIAYGASLLELVVYDEGGSPVVRANGACSDFGLTVDLPEGTYSADVTLTDAAGSSRSTTKQLNAIDVVAGTDLAIDVDFPSSSIL
jgi:hypothetical protein